METTGNCRCNAVTVRVSADIQTGELQPRRCDCDYCRSKPSGLISHPSMQVSVGVPLSALKAEKNGDRLATFFRCKTCDDLIAVGGEIDGEWRGAVNADLLACRAEFGDDVAISPKTLSPSEKQARWKMLWGRITDLSDALTLQLVNQVLPYFGRQPALDITRYGIARPDNVVA